MKVIENTLRTAKIKMLYIALLGLAGGLLIYYIWNPDYNNTIKTAAISIIPVCLLTYGLLLYIKLDYFFLDARTNKMKIKFYTANPFFRRYKAFELPKVAFVDYNIEKSFFGLKKTIILKAKTKKGDVSFPALSISLLSTAKIQRLEQLLKSIKPD